MNVVLLVTCIGSVMVLMGAEWGQRPRVRAVSKTVAAVSFLTYGLSLGALDHGGGGVALIVGLGLSVTGDLCLLSRKNQTFKLGILSFLLAHIAYVVVFVTLGIHWMWAVLGGVSVGLLGLGVARFLAPFVQHMKHAVNAYIVVISVMVALAIGMGAYEGSLDRAGLLVSAVAFFLSDLCVARERFVEPSFANKALGLPLYFGAQLGFAWFGCQVLAA